jgi:16S rRNA (guanine527-N7)-methyltransferase
MPAGCYNLITMNELIQAAHKLFNIRFSPHQVKQVETFEQELLEWNDKINLTAIRDVEGIRTKHFLDSFSCVLAWRDNPPRRLIDVGTGAGFPGIPLKIIYPSMKLTLVESIGKKTTFCRHIVETLRLEDVEVVTARGEEVGQMPAHRQNYDWAVARAVASLPVLTEYLLPLVSLGGSMLAQKGQNGPAEVLAAEKAIRLLGGKLRQVIPLTLPGIVEERFLIVVDKIAATPPAYPRLPGTPSKKPIL